MADRRILQLITRLIIGGAQEHAVLTAAGLNGMKMGGEQLRVELMSGIQTGPEGSLMEMAQEQGVAVHLMPSLVREVNPVKDLLSVGRLSMFMRKGSYDLVHTHSSKAGILGRMAARMAGVPHIVHTVHGWSFHDHMSSRKKAFYVQLEKVGARCGDKMTVVTGRDIDKGLAEGIGRREDYVVIRSGIELDRFGQPQVSREEMRRSLGIPTTALLIGAVTRLSEQKAPLDLADVWGKVGADHPDCWFLLVGDGPLRDETEARLTALGIRDRVVMTGLRRDVPELMSCMDLYSLTSLWEGLPRVLPQAMASGLPIVCTAADGSAEAVEEGVQGFLVARGDIGLAAQRLGELLQDDSLREAMGQNGRKRAELFSRAKMVADTAALYQQLFQGAH